MNLLGIHLTLLIGPTVAVPASFDLMEALVGVEVTQSDRGRSGFQLTFQIGRSGPLDLIDYGLLKNPLLRAFNRVVLLVRFAVVPQVLMDGIITQLQLAPSSVPGASTLTVTGEDVSVMMDLEQKNREWPAMPEPVIVAAILAQYPQYAMIPKIIPPLSLDFPAPTRRIPAQTETDLAYVQTLAARYSYAFYVKPGPAPLTNQAYWGPPERISFPQKALSVNMGPQTNVDSISFQYNALAPTLVDTQIQDSDTNLPIPIITPPISTRLPPLVTEPALQANLPNVRKSRLDVPHEDLEGLMRENTWNRPQAERAAGLNIAQALARAQATVDASTDQVVVATGELDALRYGEILQARGLVGLRGVGRSYDGNYYVQSVTHSIRKGSYRQRFTLNREGTGSLTPVVRP